MIQKEKYASGYQNRPKSSLQVIRSLALPKLFRKKSLFCSANSSENSTPNSSVSRFKYSSKVITKFVPPDSPHSDSNTDDNSILINKLDKVKKIYHDKPFEKFYGFTAFTFKNKESCNCDELDICINKETDVTENKNNNSSLQVHLFAMHHGINGQDVSVLLKKRLKYYLFKNINYIYNPLQGISDAYQKLEFEIYQTIPKSYECGSSSILALIIKNQIYIANIGNSKCLISCKDKTPFYILTHSNNLSARKIPNYNNHFENKQLSLTLKQCANLETPLLKTEKPFLKPINTLNHTSNLDKKQFLFAVPEITEMNITDNIYFFIFINDSIAKAIPSKKIMSIVYTTVLQSLNKDYSFKEMCYALINQICIEVMKTECTTSISVMFLPLMSFVSLYDKSNENEIEEMIKQIENENNEQVYNRCIIHEPNTNGLFNTSTINNSSMFDNSKLNGNDNLANLRTIETYNITNNKGKGFSQNNTLFSQHSTMSNNRMQKKESDKHKKKKMLCGCFA